MVQYIQGVLFPEITFQLGNNLIGAVKIVSSLYMNIHGKCVSFFFKAESMQVFQIWWSKFMATKRRHADLNFQIYHQAYMARSSFWNQYLNLGIGTITEFFFWKVNISFHRWFKQGNQEFMFQKLSNSNKAISLTRNQSHNKNQAEVIKPKEETMATEIMQV